MMLRIANYLKLWSPSILAVLCLGVLWMILHYPVLDWVGNVTGKRESFSDRAAKIKKGMTKSEVYHFLGGPPGNYSRYRNAYPYYIGELTSPPESEVWLDREWAVAVIFDGDKKVKQIWGGSVLASSKTPFEEWRDWIGF